MRPPCDKEIDQEGDNAEAGRNRTRVVADELRAQFIRTWREHRALRKADRDGQPLFGSQRRGGREFDLALIELFGPRVAAGRPHGTGVEGELLYPCAIGKLDRRFGAVDRKIPEIAGDVPVQLIVTGVESDLTIGGVGQRVSVRTGFDQDVGIADFDALAIVDGVDAIRFLMAIARRAQHVEIDMHAPAILVSISCWKDPEDSVSNLLAFGDDGDRFGNCERPGLRDADIAGVVGDALIRERRRHKQTKQRRGGNGGAAHVVNETFGAARSASLSIWKNGAGLNAPKLATRFEGNCSIITLKSRAAPL